MDRIERQTCINRLYMLHEKKNYNLESLFTAVNIFDRYLMMRGHWNAPLKLQVELCVISMVLAGKLE